MGVNKLGNLIGIDLTLVPKSGHSDVRTGKEGKGRKIVFDGQTYDYVVGRLYVCKDGSETWLITWESTCPECGVKFRFDCTEGMFARNRIRRCEAHRSMKPVHAALARVNKRDALRASAAARKARAALAGAS